MNTYLIAHEAAIEQQSRLVQAFFKTDNGCEIIESTHAMIEHFLFSENMRQVSPEMREHIVNQLRLATFVAKLEKTYVDLKNS